MDDPIETRVIPASLILGLILIWLGLGIIGSHLTQHRLEALTQDNSGEFLKVSALDHHAGWFNSSGSLQINLSPSCQQALDGRPTPTLQVDYQISHLPWLHKFSRFNWQAHTQGDGPWQVKTLYGWGHVNLLGRLHGEMLLPELRYRQGEENLQVSASRLSYALGGGSLDLNWQIERLLARQGSQQLDAQQLQLTADLDNRHIGVGKAELRLARLELPQWQLEGLVLSSDGAEKRHRVDLQVQGRAQQLSHAGQRWQEVQLPLQLKGLDIDGLVALNKAGSSSCLFTDLEGPQQASLQQGLTRLLNQGLQLDIPALQARAQQQAIRGQLQLQLAAHSGALDPARHLQASGQLALPAAALPANQLQALRQSGLFAGQGPDLSAHYDYRQGQLRSDASVLELGHPLLAELGRLSAWLNASLSSPRTATEGHPTRSTPALPPA